MSDVDYLFDQIADIFQTRWRLDAPCSKLTEEEREVFFDEDRFDEAEAICKDCPVRMKCLDTAINFEDDYYYWCVSPKERYSITVHRRRHLAVFRYDLGLNES